MNRRGTLLMLAALALPACATAPTKGDALRLVSRELEDGTVVLETWRNGRLESTEYLPKWSRT